MDDAISTAHPGRFARWFAAICIVLTVLTGSRISPARGAVPPLGIAVNRGRYETAAIEDLVHQGLAEWTTRGVNRDVVRHLRIEVFENSVASARRQTTVFAFCETTFQLVLNEGKQLERVRVEFLVLDAFGKPVDARTRRLDIKVSYREGRWVWTETNSDGRLARSFATSLPEWASRKLWQVSGFLDQNPGQPPVQFSPTIEEDLASTMGLFLELGPGVAKNALGQIAENLIKALAGSSLKKAVAADQIHWGGADDVTVEKARAHAETYIAAGKVLWKTLGR